MPNLDFNEVLGEKAKWELHNITIHCSEKSWKQHAIKTANVRLLTSLSHKPFT